MLGLMFSEKEQLFPGWKIKRVKHEDLLMPGGVAGHSRKILHGPDLVSITTLARNTERNFLTFLDKNPEVLNFRGLKNQPSSKEF